jgi:hypothetical protein
MASFRPAPLSTREADILHHIRLCPFTIFAFAFSTIRIIRSSSPKSHPIPLDAGLIALTMQAFLGMRDWLR